MHRLKDYWEEDDRKNRIREEAVARDRRIGAIIMLGLFSMFPIVVLACNDDASTVTRQVSTERTPPPVQRVDPPVVVSEASIVDSEPPSLIPENPTFQDGEVAYGERRFDDAVDIFTIWNVENPDNVWGHYMVGLAALKAGRYGESEDGFSRALELDPTHLKSLRNVARLYLETGRVEEALPDIEFAIEIDPESGETYRLLGLIQTELELNEDAIESFRRALSLDPEDAWSMNNLGLLYIRSGRFDVALGPLARAIQLRDDVPVFFNNLGVALERNGYLDDAIDAFRTTVGLDAGHERAATSLARVEAQDAVEVYAADLEQLAQAFVEEVGNWSFARHEVDDVPPLTELTSAPVDESADSALSEPVSGTEGTDETEVQVLPTEVDLEALSGLFELP